MADAQLKQQLEKAFQAFDKDGSGHIDAAEVAGVLKKHATDAQEKVDEAKIHQDAELFISQADKDKNRKVSLQEFLDFFTPHLAKK